MKPYGTNSPGRFEFFGARNCGSPNVTVLRIAQGERIIRQPSAIARQTQNQRTYFPCRKNIPLNTMAAAMSNIGASGRKRVPTPTINPAPSAVYSALFHGGRRSEEHTSELQSHLNLVCRLLLEKKNNIRWR